MVKKKGYTMIKFIVLGRNMRDSERIYKEYCYSNNIPCRLGEALLLSCRMRYKEISQKLRGYYNEVMNDNIKLIGFDKDDFKNYYFKF